ncbi:hypothetical protein ACFYWU_15115 [Streptomyces chrestomyceticus]|uniref:hypothetical protein n=1 Tax=Streptomyces chrestomyceticus TaxID=68185 RepID=UPI0019D253D1|nr:hypothetical protein [Streptomyces chrestomyceticus]
MAEVKEGSKVKAKRDLVRGDHKILKGHEGTVKHVVGTPSVPIEVKQDTTHEEPLGKGAVEVVHDTRPGTLPAGVKYDVTFPLSVGGEWEFVGLSSEDIEAV